MPYITMPMETKFHQITWDELLSGYVEPERFDLYRMLPRVREQSLFRNPMRSSWLSMISQN